MVAEKNTLLQALDEVAEKPLGQLTEREGNQRMVCFLAAQGDDVDMIAKKLDLPVAFVNGCVNSAQGADMIIRLQNAIFPDVKLRIERLANMALDRKVKLMLTSQNDAVVNSVTTDILDRTLGKAIQVTENRNLNLNMNDPHALDKAIEAQSEKLAKLEAIEARVRAASG